MKKKIQKPRTPQNTQIISEFWGYSRLFDEQFWVVLYQYVPPSTRKGQYLITTKTESTQYHTTLPTGTLDYQAIQEMIQEIQHRHRQPQFSE